MLRMRTNESANSKNYDFVTAVSTKQNLATLKTKNK